MEAFSPIVASTTGVMARAVADLHHRRHLRRQSVRDDFTRAAMLLWDPLQKL